MVPEQRWRRSQSAIHPRRHQEEQHGVGGAVTNLEAVDGLNKMTALHYAEQDDLTEVCRVLQADLTKLDKDSVEKISVDRFLSIKTSVDKYFCGMAKRPSITALCLREISSLVVRCFGPTPCQILRILGELLDFSSNWQFRTKKGTKLPVLTV